IFLFGAEFTAVYAESRGSQPAPTPHAQEHVATMARPRSAAASFVPGSTKRDVLHHDHKRSKTRVFKWVALTALVLCLLAVVGLVVVNRQLPALIERQLNAHVDG